MYYLQFLWRLFDFEWSSPLTFEALWLLLGYIKICYCLVAKHAIYPCSCRHGLSSLPFGFVVMVFVYAGRVFTSRYMRLNKGTCRPSDLPCRLFITVPHEP